jgi:hypothetical protein
MECWGAGVLGCWGAGCWVLGAGVMPEADPCHARSPKKDGSERTGGGRVDILHFIDNVIGNVDPTLPRTERFPHGKNNHL